MMSAYTVNPTIAWASIHSLLDALGYASVNLLEDAILAGTQPVTSMVRAIACLLDDAGAAPLALEV